MKGIQFYTAAVLVAAVVQWVIGAIWYGVAFKKRWTVLVGKLAEPKPGRMAFEMIGSFIMSIILSFVMANVIAALGAVLWAGPPPFMSGVAVGIMCWFGFIAPPMLTQHLFERRPVNLFAINAAYWVVAMAFSGGVLAVMMK